MKEGNTGQRCVGTGEKQKRSHDDDKEQEPARKWSKPSDTNVDSLNHW